MLHAVLKIQYGSIATMQPSQLINRLKPVCLLASSEPLLVRDWLDELRPLLREHGFEDVQRFLADTSFDWQALVQEGDMMSLFSAKKCRIINLPTGKPGQQGGKVIQALCANPPEDSLFLFVSPSLDWQSKKAAWCKSIQSLGEVVELKPVNIDKLSDWILQRARRKGLEIDLQSAQFLADCTEGNLLATDQELEKLKIRFVEKKSIDFETIKSSVAQSSRYSNFLLTDACLAGDTPRALAILRSLATEGYATPQLRWSLQAALEQLDYLAQAKNSGGLSRRVWQSLRIWDSKQTLFTAALKRLRSGQIESLLQSCATLDRIGKGQLDSKFPGQDWAQLKSLVVDFSGKTGG